MYHFKKKNCWLWTTCEEQCATILSVNAGACRVLCISTQRSQAVAEPNLAFLYSCCQAQGSHCLCTLYNLFDGLLHAATRLNTQHNICGYLQRLTRRTTNATLHRRCKKTFATYRRCHRVSTMTMTICTNDSACGMRCARPRVRS